MANAKDVKRALAGNKNLSEADLTGAKYDRPSPRKKPSRRR